MDNKITKFPKTLQFKALERFMSPKELELFKNAYLNHKLGSGGANRGQIYSRGITTQELNILKDYLTNLDLNIKEIGIKYGKTTRNLYSAMLRVALRVIYQNPEILDKIQTEG